jgi:hypothetical protein
MLREAMDADQIWPDIWFISDHGNPHRIDPTSHESPAWGSRPRPRSDTTRDP